MSKRNASWIELSFFFLFLFVLTACGGGGNSTASNGSDVVSLNTLQKNADKPNSSQKDQDCTVSCDDDADTTAASNNDTKQNNIISTNTDTQTITTTYINTEINTVSCIRMYNFRPVPCDPVLVEDNQANDDADNDDQHAFCDISNIDSLDVDDAGLDLVLLRIPAEGNRLYNVGTLEAFNHAASVAQSGDVVVIATGSYEHWDMQIPSVGVRYVSAVGGVAFFNTASMTITGSENTVSGFIFKEVESLKVIEIYGGDRNRITGNVFVNLGRDVKTSTLSAIALKNGADNNRIDHNLMQRNRSVGVHIVLPDDNVGNITYSKNNRIDNNHFEDAVLYPGSAPPISILIGDKQGQYTLDHACVTIDNNEFAHNELINIGGYANGIQVVFNSFEKVKNAVAIELIGESLLIQGNTFDEVDSPISITSSSQTLLDNVILKERVYEAYAP